MRSRFRVATMVLAGTVALLAIASGTAQADTAGSPTANHVVGVGSDTTQFVMSTLTDHYNAKSPAPTNPLYSYDAVGSPASIPLKPGCTAITRPNGSSAGISALKADTNHC